MKSFDDEDELPTKSTIASTTTSKVVETTTLLRMKSFWKKFTIISTFNLIVFGLISSHQEIKRIQNTFTTDYTRRITGNDVANIYRNSTRHEHYVSHDSFLQHRLNQNESSSTVFSSSHPVHVLLALSGDHPGFFLEVEVALKSILMNAPETTSLTVHIMADGPAYYALEDMFQRIQEIQQWKSNHPITIRAYDCSGYIPQWENKVRHLYNISLDKGRRKSWYFNHSMEHHTIGTWFRLMADEVLPKEVKHIVYMDSDVIMMANLQDLFNHISDDAYLHWGKMKCAGFVILNVHQLQKMWYVVEHAYETKLKILKRNLSLALADQSFLAAFEYEQPEYVSILPDAWDNHLANGLYRYKKKLLQERPEIGYIHFNGGGTSKSSWFFDEYGNFTFWVSAPHVYIRDTFGLVDYYIRMPWPWAQYFSAAKIPKGQIGYNMTLEYISEGRSISEENVVAEVYDPSLTPTN